MRKVLTGAIAAVLMTGLVSGAMPVFGQETKPSSASQTEKPRLTVVPLRVTVTIGRFQGEKRIGNLPFVLSLNTGGRTSVQMGSSVPIPASDTGKQFDYRSVGTNISCSAGGDQGDARYRLSLNVTDNQIFMDAPGGIKGIPAFQNFTLTNDVILRDGETISLGAGVDKATGETIRVDVTLNVVK